MKGFRLYKVFIFFILIVLSFWNWATCIFDDNFTLTLSSVSLLPSAKSLEKYELTFALYFKEMKRAENFFLSALIPAESLHMLSFSKEMRQTKLENVKIEEVPYVADKKDPCDHKLYQKRLMTLDDENLKKFKIYKNVKNITGAKEDIPGGYRFFSISMRPLFTTEPIIYNIAYTLKVTVEIKPGGMSTEDSWIFGISEKNTSEDGKKHHCTIYSDKLAKPFFELLSKKKLSLDFCNSITNAEFLNFSPHFRKTIQATIQSDKLFYGANDVTYTIEMNLEPINPTNMYSDNIQISIKIPVGICYTGNCFMENMDNPCLNLKRPVYFKCSYTPSIFEFILFTDKKEKISNLTFRFTKMKNPKINFQAEDSWEINIFTIDPLNVTLTETHKNILETVSQDNCAKKLITYLFQKREDIPWVESHHIKLKMPQLTFLKLRPLENSNVLENPLAVEFQIEYEGDKEYKNCVFELKSIHNFISVLTKGDYRVNPFNQQLFLPCSIYKPKEESEKYVEIKKENVKSGDNIRAVINIDTYNNREYWFSTLTCLNTQGEYIREGFYKFENIISHVGIYVSDLYIYEKKQKETYVFYMNALFFDAKEIEFNIQLPKEDNVNIANSCSLEMFASCYDLIYYKCKKEKKLITYHLNSYKTSNKYFSVYFPLLIKDTTVPFELSIVTNSLTDTTKKLTKKIQVDLKKTEEQLTRKICVNDFKIFLKKYEKYNSHLFLLFKVVHCDKIYEPYITSNYNHEEFYIKEESLLPPIEKFNFQKTYRQKYPLNYNSISYKLFQNNILAIHTFIIIDESIIKDLGVKGQTLVDHIKTKILFFQFNYYYVAIYTSEKLEIELCSIVKPTVVKCSVVQTLPQVGELHYALEKVVLYSETVKNKLSSTYIYSETAFLILTCKKNIETIKSNIDDYKYKDSYLNQSISRIYVASFENGTDPTTYEKEFNISLQNNSNIFIYPMKKTQQSSLLFIAFYHYIIDMNLLFYYVKATVEDFILLHTKLFKTSWILIGACRNNILKKGNLQRKLHIYYVNQKLKTVPYTCLEEDVENAYDNSSTSSSQDICNIFTQLQLLGYKI